MSTETFKAKHLETREDSIRIEYLGKNVFLPRSHVERLSIADGFATVTIPYWLYKDKFENE